MTRRKRCIFLFKVSEKPSRSGLLGRKMINLVKTLMTLRGVNQSDLSKRTGVSVTAISRYLNENSEIRSEALIRILSALGTDVDAMLKSDINRVIGQDDDKSIGDDIRFLMEKASPIARKTIAETLISSFKNDKSSDTKSRLQRIKRYKESIKTVRRLS